MGKKYKLYFEFDADEDFRYELGYPYTEIEKNEGQTFSIYFDFLEDCLECCKDILNYLIEYLHYEYEDRLFSYVNFLKSHLKVFNAYGLIHIDSDSMGNGDLSIIVSQVSWIDNGFGGELEVAKEILNRYYVVDNEVYFY